MKLLSKIYKIQNTPIEILKKKLMKKLSKKRNINDEKVYFKANDLRIKNGLFKIDLDYYHNFKIAYEDCCDFALDNKMKIFSKKYISVSDFETDKSSYKNINWQKDFHSGFEWDINTRSKNIIFGVGENEKNPELRKYIGAEIKFPWELGRQQDLVNIAIFSAICEAERKTELIDFYINRIYDFSNNNPIGFGVQWQTSMDIAIRAVNYLISYDILKSNGAKFDNEFENHFCDIIQNHFFYINNHLEYNDGLRGNHYLANLMGLIVIYAYLDFNFEEDKREFQEIFKFAVNSFSEEILYQFNKDGGNFEASIPYHYFASEMLLLSLFFLEKTEDNEFEHLAVSNSEIHYHNNLKNRILNIIEFSKNFLINGCIPNIGDNDSGFVVNLSSEQDNHYLFLLLLYKFENNLDRLKFLSSTQIINELLFKVHNYFLAEDFGISRSSNINFDLIVFAGSKGQNGKGGHSHNDKCSFELYYNGKPLIVDLGSAFYTSNWKKRNYYRSVRQHNLLHINYEQEEILAEERDDLFWLYGNKSKAKISTANNQSVKCSHWAYRKEYLREFELNETSLQAREYLNNKFEKFVAFHFHPSCEVEVINGKVEIVFENNRFLLTCENNKINIEDAIYSIAYGIEEKCRRVLISSKDVEIKWKLELIEN